jgi:predicted NAD/FAD-binding protein
MSRLAIIGTGIAGLGCAHFLHRRCDLALYEQNDYPGGHTHTIDLAEAGRTVPVDTGFMVFNRVTYPLLTRLFERFQVPMKPAAMSFSVRHADTGLEFCGTSLNHLFAQRRNLFRPRFYRMLRSIDRFNREAVAALDQPEIRELTLGEYVRRGGYGADFFDLYLVPMSSAVWSTPPERMLEFPAATLLRFFHNHGFLGLHTQHPWLTVEGGARTYVQKISAPWRDRVRLSRKVVLVRRGTQPGSGVGVMTADGAVEVYDRVILACHADQALRLIAGPTADELRLLREFHYQPNMATVHTDSSVMPRTRLAWASWNYEIARDAAGGFSAATH